MKHMSAAVKPDPVEVAALAEALESLGFDSSGAEACVAAWAAKKLHRETYLQLQLPPSAVRFVDTEESLLEAAAALEGVGTMDVLGLDCEWEQYGGCGTPVSILQVYHTSSIQD